MAAAFGWGVLAKRLKVRGFLCAAIGRGSGTGRNLPCGARAGGVLYQLVWEPKRVEGVVEAKIVREPGSFGTQTRYPPTELAQPETATVGDKPLDNAVYEERERRDSNPRPPA